MADLNTMQINVINDKIDYLRKRCKEQALEVQLGAENLDVNKMATAAAKQAEMIGELFCWSDLQRYMENDVVDCGVLAKVVIDNVMRGPDDGWSGRTNDLQRAKFDGYRKTAEAFLQLTGLGR